jgi:hypothetical protein
MSRGDSGGVKVQISTIDFATRRLTALGCGRSRTWRGVAPPATIRNQRVSNLTWKTWFTSDAHQAKAAHFARSGMKYPVRSSSTGRVSARFP